MIKILPVCSHFIQMSIIKIFNKTFIEDELFDSMHAAINNCTNYIIAHGSFTIFGWVCSSAMKDKSGDVGAADAIESLNVNPHVSYLYPTEEDIINDLLLMNTCFSCPSLHIHSSTYLLYHLHC